MRNDWTALNHAVYNILCVKIMSLKLFLFPLSPFPSCLEQPPDQRETAWLSSPENLVPRGQTLVSQFWNFLPV